MPESPGVERPHVYAMILYYYHNETSQLFSLFSKLFYLKENQSGGQIPVMKILSNWACIHERS